MEEKGIVLELRKKEAVVVNNRGQYKRIKRVSGMFLGQMVNYNNKAMVPYKLYRYIAAVSGAAALLIFMFFSGLFFMNNLQPRIFAYIDIDINPSMEFSIDENEQVISFEPLNSDAEKTVGSLDLKGLDINSAVSMVIEKLEENGYISPQKKNLILISAYPKNKNGLSKVQIDSNNSKLNKTVITLKEAILKKKNGMVSVKTINLPQEVKKPTKDNKISAGRYVLYKNAIEKGVKITQDEAKSIPLNELIEKTADKENVEIEETKSKSDTVSMNTDNTQNNESNISDTGNKYEDTSKEVKENNIDDKKPKESVNSINKRKNGKDNVKDADERAVKNTPGVVTEVLSDIPESTPLITQSTPTPAEKDKKPEHTDPKNKVQPEEKEKGNTDSPRNKEKNEEKNNEPLKPKPEDKENVTDKPTLKPKPEDIKPKPEDKENVTDKPTLKPATKPTLKPTSKPKP